MSLFVKYVNELKKRVNAKRSNAHVTVPFEKLKDEALLHFIRNDQLLHFPELFNYLESVVKTLTVMPPLITQLIIFRDNKGLLRAKSKLKSLQNSVTYPILLSKNSHVAKLIIQETHDKLAHVGVYSVLSRLRQIYSTPSCFSAVKKYPRECILRED